MADEIDDSVELKEEAADTCKATMVGGPVDYRVTVVNELQESVGPQGQKYLH